MKVNPISPIYRPMWQVVIHQNRGALVSKKGERKEFKDLNEMWKELNILV